MIIERVSNIEEARECDELLTKLIQNEGKFNSNIKPEYVIYNWFEKFLNDEDKILFVAKDNKKIVGYIYCRFVSSDNGPTIESEALIDGLYIEAEYRNQGLASNLIDKVKEWCKNNGIKILLLNVLEQNKDAINLYYSKGFNDFEKTLKLELN